MILSNVRGPALQEFVQGWMHLLIWAPCSKPAGEPSKCVRSCQSKHVLDLPGKAVPLETAFHHIMLGQMLSSVAPVHLDREQ